MNRAIDELSRLAELGRVARIETGADGRHLVHVFVAEPIAEELALYLHDPITFEAFPVPSGRLHVTGAEYLFHSDDARLRKHPHMGGCATLEAGDHRVIVYRAEYPDGLIEGLLKAQVDPWIYALHQGFGCPIAVLFATIVGVGIMYSLVVAVCILAIGVALLWGVRRVPRLREAEQRWRRIQRRFPSIVIAVDPRLAA